MIRVGKPAPDFTAPAYYKGKFVMTSLSVLGKWILYVSIRGFHFCLSNGNLSSC